MTEGINSGISSAWKLLRGTINFMLENQGISMILLIIILGILFLIATVFAAVRSTPKAKGKAGENYIQKIIQNTIHGNGYILKDYLFSVNGKSCQIDHIVICANGVFVIETKNFSGRIYGSEEQREWTQVLANGQVKNKLYNPLKQNLTHIYMVKKILPQNVFPIPLVVFVQGNIGYLSTDKVLTPVGLKRELLRPRETVLSAEQQQAVYNKLISAVTVGENAETEHILSIHRMQEDIALGICPRCGGKLVERQGKYGRFFGCSNYPKCRFTKK